MWNTIFTSQASLDTIKENLEEYLDDEIDMRLDYSGRGMYGKPCVGFVTNEPSMLLMALTATLIDGMRSGEGFDYPEWRDLTPAMDNMARSTIVYFTNWQLDTESDDDE